MEENASGPDSDTGDGRRKERIKSPAPMSAGDSLRQACAAEFKKLYGVAGDGESIDPWPPLPDL
jgi:hypothetical protein